MSREIRRALFEEWDAVTGRRVFFRRALAATAAAAVLLATFGTLLLRTSVAPAAVVASVERVRGDAQADGAALAIGAAVSSAQRIDTHSGQVALRLANGGSLRLAPQTRITFAAAGRASLDAGTVYFDSESGAAAVEVPDAARHRARRRNAVRRASRRRAARRRRARRPRGDRARFRRGRRRRGRACLGDERRVGAEARAERFVRRRLGLGRAARTAVRHQRTPVDRLPAVGRNADRSNARVRGSRTERVARDTVLNGSIDLEPLPMLAAVLALTDLGYALDGDRIVIRAAK